MPISGFAIFAIVLVLFVIITLIAGMKQVPQGYNYTVERFGRYSRTLGAGSRPHHPLSSRGSAPR